MFLCRTFLAMSLILFGLSEVGAKSNPKDKPKYKPFYPDGMSVGESVICSLGKSAGCEPVSTELLRNLDECAGSLSIMGLVESIGFLLKDEYAETFFFQELANRTLRATECQVSILEPSQRTPLHDSGWALFQELRPLLRILTEEKGRLQAEFNSLNLAAADPRIAGPSGITARRSRLREKIGEINRSIDGLLSQLPFGSLKDTRDALKPLVGRTNVTKAQFTSAYTSGLDAVRVSLIEARDTFQKIREKDTGEFKLSISQKIELYSTPGAQSLLDQLDPNRKSLGCLFDACYKTGPRNAKIAAIIGLVGATILTAGQASPLLAAVTALGAVSFSAVQIQNSCFKDTLASTSEIYTSCSSYSLANTALSKVNGVQCAVDVALSALDAVPGAAAIRRVSQARRLASGLKTLESEGVRFVRRNPDGSIVTRRSDGTEITLHLNGRRETVYTNGAREVEENGVITISYSNGMKDVKENGITISHMPDGTPFRKTYPDGKTEELLTRADEIHEVETIVVTGKRPAGSGIVVSAVDKTLTKYRKIQFDRNLKRFSEQYRREHPGASKAEIRSNSLAQAKAKEARVAKLHNQCTSIRPNISNLQAGKIFAKYSMGFSAANTAIGYSMATWDEVKDAKWASRLGFEVTSSIILSFISSKIISGPGSTFPTKVLQSNLTSFVGNIADALAYQGLFNSADEARKEIEAMTKSPTFTDDVNELLDYMNNRSEIQEYVDGVGDMTNNLIKAITGKESLQDLTAEELANLNPEALQNPEVRERMLDLVDDKLQAADSKFTTGSAGMDRLTFNTGYNLANVPVQTAIGMATFYAVCMHIDSPIKALAAFSAIQFVRGSASSFVYYRTRENLIDQ